MRQINLQNESGLRYDLMGNDGVYLFSPEGLGVSYKHSFRDIDIGFYKLSKKKQSQGVISGTVFFLAPAYKKYQEFVAFCERAEKLYFVYAPLETEYYCEVNLQSVEKTELDIEGTLQCPVKFDMHSLWYTLSDVILNFGDSNYKSMYPGIYDEYARYGSKTSGLIEVIARGHTSAGLIVEIAGECENPSIKLVGALSGKIYGECSLLSSFSESDTIVLSTKYDDSYIVKRASNGDETNLIDVLDISKNAFFRVPVTEKCVLSVTGGSGLSITGKVYDYYRSV